MRAYLAYLLLGLVALAGCGESTPKPDYTIRVMPTDKGMVAMPPDCPSWVTDVQNPFDNQPMPQFGCATARNLALMTERPEDLVSGRDLGDTRGVPMVGAIRRYDNNQTRGLIWTATDPSQAATTTAPAASSTLTGDAAASSAKSSSPAGP
jgi:hypothetical protein